jgi:HSP20 family protein
MFELLRTFSNGNQLSPFAQFDVARPFAALAASTGPHAADVVETADDIRVEIDLPGFAGDAITVGFEDGVLTIAAERKAEEVAGGTYLVAERGYGKVRRSFAINVPVDGEKIQAAYDQGVLKVTLPKRAEAKPRKIDVKVK